MKKLLTLLAIVAMLFSFASCDNGTPEPDPTPKGEELAEYFGTYNDAAKVSEDGESLILGIMDHSEEGFTGVSTYFGNNDTKVTPVDKTASVSFTLDVSKMAQDDYTAFSLGLGSNTAYVTEYIVGISKTADGFTLVQTNGFSHNNSDTREGNTADGKNDIKAALDVGNANIKIGAVDEISLIYEVDLTDKTKPVVTLKSGTATLEFKNGAESYEGIAGLRYLWNVTSSVDTVKLVDFTPEIN